MATKIKYQKVAVGIRVKIILYYFFNKFFTYSKSKNQNLALICNNVYIMCYTLYCVLCVTQMADWGRHWKAPSRG